MACEWITSPAVGEIATPGRAHARIPTPFEFAAKEQIFALLAHQSAVVRGSAASHILRAWPSEAAPVLRLLADKTPVYTIIGCEATTRALGDYLMEELFELRRDPEVRRLLLAASADKTLPNGRRKRARRWAEGR